MIDGITTLTSYNFVALSDKLVPAAEEDKRCVLWDCGRLVRLRPAGQLALSLFPYRLPQTYQIAAESSAHDWRQNRSQQDLQQERTTARNNPSPGNLFSSNF